MISSINYVFYFIFLCELDLTISFDSFLTDTLYTMYQLLLTNHNSLHNVSIQCYFKYIIKEGL